MPGWLSRTWRSHAVHTPQDIDAHGTLREWLAAPFGEEYFSFADADLLTFMYMWVTATSGLFGPDMMSLRPMSELMTLFLSLVAPRDQAASGSDSSATRAAGDVAIDLTPLVLLLQSKNSTLPMPFCRAVVDALWSFRLRGNRTLHLWNHLQTVFSDLVNAGANAAPRVARKYAINLPPSGVPTRGSFLDAYCRRLGGTIQRMALDTLKSVLSAPANCVHVLTLSALLDSSGNACSYPEFVARSNVVQRVYQHHPLTRLACWCWYVRPRFGSPVRVDHCAHGICCGCVCTGTCWSAPSRQALAPPHSRRRCTTMSTSCVITM